MRSNRALVAVALGIALLSVGTALPRTRAVTADIYVGLSSPGASDAGPCTDPSAPCLTIQSAVNKAQAGSGGVVGVLPNPDGSTKDIYDESVIIDGTPPVTLIGAGALANGTRLAPSTGTPLTLGAGATARSLEIIAPAGATAITAAAGSAVGDVVAQATGGTCYDGAGSVEDSQLIGATGARLNGGRLVRTVVVGTTDGIVAQLGSIRLLQVIVRSRTTNDLPPTGDALRVAGASVAMRHVTLTGFPTRTRVDARTSPADLTSANATFADETGTDLHMQGATAKVQLRTSNAAPPRTLLTDGAVAGKLTIIDPVDLVPEITPNGHLLPTSPLIDRGTRDGTIRSDPGNATDIDGTARIQGLAPDIGADESPPARPDGLRWTTIGTFVRPMWVASPPGDIDRVFVVQRKGKVLVVENGQILATPALNLEAKVSNDGEGSFNTLAFAPDFASSRRLYGFYTRRDDPVTPEFERGDIVIAEWTMVPGNPNQIDPASERQVMYIDHSSQQQHYGGAMMFGPDGYLWITLGDAGSRDNAQELSTLLGKVIRIDPRESGGSPYTVPADNPFVGVAGALPEIWAYGLRNPFRAGFDVANGDYWIGDVGQHQFEEANSLRDDAGRVPGANFGWKFTEGNVFPATGEAVTPANAPPGYVAPAIVMRHDEGDRSITGGTVVRDPTIAALEGGYVYADFFTGVTRAAVGAPGGVSSDGEVEGLPPLPFVTSYQLDGCRRVYSTQHESGEVKRLTTTGQCVPPPPACTVLGTSGDDNLVGTNSRDVMCGLGGNDRLSGLGGNDVLSGGPGDDSLDGGPGADVIQGGEGIDLADYASRVDALDVTIGSGADDGAAGEGDNVELDIEWVRGGSANDRLVAGARTARLLGGPGPDVLIGSPSADRFEGQGGDDDITGGIGNDVMYGGDGMDRLRADDGVRDRLVCGVGIDVTESDGADLLDPSCE